jgi:hypothetical protein
VLKMLGCADHGFLDISAMALKAAIRGMIFAEPEACLVTRGTALWLELGVA